MLQLRPFINSQQNDEKVSLKKITRPILLPVNLNAKLGFDINDKNDAAFNNIINATLVIDRTGIQAKQRSKNGESEIITVIFSRTVIGALKK